MIYNLHLARRTGWPDNTLNRARPTNGSDRGSYLTQSNLIR